MPRRFVLLTTLCALALLAFACSEDTTLEDLGGEVQATRMARATFAAENFTPPPTSTPEPAVFADQRALALHAQGIDSFFNFVQIRVTDSDARLFGSIGDDDGQLKEGWIENCCERQFSAAQQAIDDTAATLLEVQTAYEEEGSAEHLALVSTAQAQLEEVREILDALPAAASLDEATFIAATGRSAAGQLIVTVEELSACCEPASTPPADEPQQ